MATSSSVFASDVVPTFYGKRVWPDRPSKEQKWPFKESLIYYIAQNPSSAKFYQKMVQSCMYFHEKNPIIAISTFSSCKKNFECVICTNTLDECFNNERKCCVTIDIAKVSSKIWITDRLIAIEGAKNFTSILCAKLYRCEISRLEIWEKVIIFDDLQLLTSSAKEIILYRNLITYKDGKTVMIDEILESSPVVTDFGFFFDDDDVSMVNVSTMKNIMKLKNLAKIEGFGLHNLLESLSIEDIFAFFKKYEHVKIAFSFNENISEEYKNQLDTLIDEIIESAASNRLIKYDGQNEEKWRIMKSRCAF